MLRLSEFWLSLSQDAELKRRLAQPAEYRAVWLLPAAAGVVAWLGFSSGEPGLGWVAAVFAVLAIAWMVSHIRAAVRAREAWAASLYCRRCPLVFLPVQGVVKA